MILDLPLLDISLSSIASWLGRPSFCQSADQSTKCTRAFFFVFPRQNLSIAHGRTDILYRMTLTSYSFCNPTVKLSEGALDEIACSGLASGVDRVESGAEIERRGKNVEERGRVLIPPALSPFNLTVLALVVFGFNDLISQSECINAIHCFSVNIVPKRKAHS